jgi:hypothetical protein
MDRPSGSKKRSNSGASSAGRRVKPKPRTYIPSSATKSDGNVAIVTTLKKGRKRNTVAKVPATETCTPTPGPPALLMNLEKVPGPDGQESEAMVDEQGVQDESADWEDEGKPTKADEKAKRGSVKTAVCPILPYEIAMLIPPQ